MKLIVLRALYGSLALSSLTGITSAFFLVLTLPLIITKKA
jgi:hypothetical protein